MHIYLVSNTIFGLFCNELSVCFGRLAEFAVVGYRRTLKCHASDACVNFGFVLARRGRSGWMMCGVLVFEVVLYSLLSAAGRFGGILADFGADAVHVT